MKRSNMAVLMALMVVALAIGPASAATVTVNPGDNISNVINTANSGDTVIFNSGTYNGIAVNITKPLTLECNGAVTLVGTGTDSAVLNVLNTSGVSISGFTINGCGDRDYICLTNVNSSSITSNTMNNNVTNTTAVYITNGYNINVMNNLINLCNYGWNTGIAAKGIYGGMIENNNISNGGEGMNIYQSYRNLTISGNNINHMATHYGDGISLVNCVTPETSTSTKITNNIVNDTNYGIFLGGYFKGTVSGNSLDNSAVAGMNITGKQKATSGSLYATITNNNITNAQNIGMSFENPDVKYLKLTNIYITSVGPSIAKNQYYTLDPNSHTISEGNLNCNNTVADLFSNGS